MEMADEKSDWTFGRLFQVKKDVSDLQNSVENIARFGYTAQQVESLLNSSDAPADIKDLADDPLVKVGTAIRSSLSVLTQFIKVANITLPKPIQDSIDADTAELNDRSKLIDFNKVEKVEYDESKYPPPLPKLADESVLIAIFTDKSAAESDKYDITESNERLSLLGKSVLDEIVTRQIYRTYATLDSRPFTILRARVLSDQTLIKWAKDYNLHEYSVDELNIPKDQDHEIYGKLFQAYIGGLYVDSNFNHKKVGPWLEELIGHFFSTITLSSLTDDAPSSGYSDVTLPSAIAQEYKPSVPQQPDKSPSPSGYSSSQPQDTYSQAQSNNSSNPLAQPTQPNAYQTHYGPIPQASISHPGGILNEIKFAKESLYKRVCLAFIPEYISLERGTHAGAPTFKCACSVHGEVLGVGEGETLKTAGSVAAYNAIQYNRNGVEKYARLAIEIKSKRIPMPPTHPTSAYDQARNFQTNSNGAPR